MSKTEHIIYHCEKCGRKLKSYRNNMDIVTSLNENGYWSRLHVQIIHVHGMHNDSTTEPADLCKSCAVALLTDALKRVRAGERATAGTEEIEEGKW